MVLHTKCHIILHLLKKLSLIFIVFVFSELVLADKIEYRVKAAYLYQFTKFTQWPILSEEQKNNPIRICILGDNPFGSVLDKLSKKTSQNRYLLLEYLTFPKNSLDIVNCQLIFISSSEEPRLTKILKLTENSPVLTVSDMKNFALRGGIIGLVLDNQKIRLEINFEASAAAGLKISSKLLEIATVIKSKMN
ncbi:hypothetical protein MNBD_GAMMA22-2452 [hydrothermal vent metagenome]|uniref:Transmembrane protein n=1 Tax=hydrothermal vent metagenome TaxID=652676 RepID=A0A3B1AEA6_9ZZZZ